MCYAGNFGNTQITFHMRSIFVFSLFILIAEMSFAQGGNSNSPGEFPNPGRFHKLLARSVGTWTGEGTIQFSSDAAPVSAGTSVLVNSMSSDGLYQISEIKGKPGRGKPWTGLRITGYDSFKKVFTRAMIGDSPSIEGVAMEGPWDEASQSFSMLFKKADATDGKEQKFKEVYTILDENTEILEIYTTDPQTKKEFRMLQVKWTRTK